MSAESEAREHELAIARLAAELAHMKGISIPAAVKILKAPKAPSPSPIPYPKERGR